MNADVFSSMLKALAMPDQVEISCYPVRVSATGGIGSLLENEYQPPEWLPLLQIIIGRIGKEEDEDSILFQLLRSVVESGSQDIAMHIPYIVSSLVRNMLKFMHPSADPWSQQSCDAVAAAAIPLLSPLFLSPNQHSTVSTEGSDFRFPVGFTEKNGSQPSTDHKEGWQHSAKADHSNQMALLNMFQTKFVLVDHSQ